jgi:hypothetical protein
MKKFSSDQLFTQSQGMDLTHLYNFSKLNLKLLELKNLSIDSNPQFTLTERFTHILKDFRMPLAMLEGFMNAKELWKTTYWDKSNCEQVDSVNYFETRFRFVFFIIFNCIAVIRVVLLILRF